MPWQTHTSGRPASGRRRSTTGLLTWAHVANMPSASARSTCTHMRRGDVEQGGGGVGRVGRRRAARKAPPVRLPCDPGAWWPLAALIIGCFCL